MDSLDVILCVTFEAGGGGQINARIGAEFGLGFFLTVVEFVNLGPFGPGIVGGTFQGGTR